MKKNFNIYDLYVFSRCVFLCLMIDFKLSLKDVFVVVFQQYDTILINFRRNSSANYTCVDIMNNHYARKTKKKK